jgi:hypothetical protein
MRYEEPSENLVEVFLELLEDRFPGLAYLKYKIIFDNKKKINRGRFVLTDFILVSERLRFFTKDEVAADGYDYILTVNKKAWELAGDKDKRRMLSHEMRHIFVDEKGTPKLIGHEIEDFYEEIKLNQDDPEWARKLGRLVIDVYEQEKEAKKAK